MAILQQLSTLHAFDFLPISEPQMAEIQCKTSADLVLQCLVHVTLQGWPNQKEALPSEIHPYFTVRHELTVQDGIFFKGLCQPEAQNIEQLHGALTGVESCLQQSHSGIGGEY